MRCKSIIIFFFIFIFEKKGVILHRENGETEDTLNNSGLCINGFPSVPQNNIK